MTTSTDEVNVKIRGEAGDLKAAMGEGAASVKKGAADMRASLDGMRSSMSMLRTAVPVLALVELGNVMIRVARQSIEMGDNLNKAAIKAGLTGEAMSSLSYAAKMADVDLSALSTALRFMQVNLSQAGSGAKGPLETLTALGLTFKQLSALAPDKQFELLADRISLLKDPADKARAATELFGRAGSSLLPMFEQGAEGIKKAREEAEKLGLVMKNDQVKALAEADDAVKRLSASWEHFGMVITSKVAGPLKELLDMLSGKGGFVAGMKGGLGKDDVLDQLRWQVKSLRANPEMDSPAMRAIKEEQIAAIEERIRRIEDGGGRGGPGRIGVTPGGYKPPAAKGYKGPSSEDRTETWLAGQVGSGMAAAGDDARAIVEEQARSDLALSRQMFEQKRQLSQQEVDMKADGLQQMAALGQISRVEEIEGLRKLEQERFAIEEKALARKAGELAAEPIERQKALDELEIIEREHYERLRQMDIQARAERMRPMAQLFGTIRSGLQGTLQNFLNFQQGVGATLRGLAASIVGAFTEMGSRILAQWLTMKIAQLIFSKSTIAGKAAEAGAGGVASMAGAPFPLNLSAPAFGAAMGALAASYLAIPAAAGGWDLPTGINPIAQLHSGEMVLPQKHADVIRAMAEGGGAGGSVGGSTVLNIKALDTRDVARTLSRSNGGPIGKAMRAHLRSMGYRTP